jgi:guanylate kinase
MAREPNLYVIAAPSGGGKTSLVNALLARDEKISLSISHTTRPPRPGEIDGVHYYFVDEKAFKALVAEGALLEHARVFGHFYGTGREAVSQKLAEGYDVMLDIDWQGARQIKQSFPSCCSIFILPPSLEELHKRLSERGQDSAEVIARRMREARSEITHCREFDFAVINDDFKAALDDLYSIVRQRKPVRTGQEARIAALLAELL